MLNITFPASMERAFGNTYVAPENIAGTMVLGNSEMSTGLELRLQPVYADELWRKINRAGLSAMGLAGKDVLEVCAGTGFLTNHLLQRCRPGSMTVNDISAVEMSAARTLLDRTCPGVPIEWLLGDMHELNLDRRFDVIIGNSFLHHFHDVPRVLARMVNMLKPGGVFVSLHEPTPMSVVVEASKAFLWPVAALAPGYIAEIARSRYCGPPSNTDIWMFRPHELVHIAKHSGFGHARTIPWGLSRPVVVQRLGLHLNNDKPSLSEREEATLRSAVVLDSVLSRWLPKRCFGSISLVCYR